MATIAMTIIVIDTIQICVPIVVKFYCFYLFVTLFIKRGFPLSLSQIYCTSKNRVKFFYLKNGDCQKNIHQIV